MNKNFFVDYISLLLTFDKITSNYSDLFQVENPLYKSFNDLASLVRKEWLTEEQNEWIDWWMYDYQQGCTVTDKDGNIIELDTIEQLWDFIQ